MPAPPHPDLRRWLGATAAIAAAVNRPAPLPDLLDLVARTAAELMGYDFCAVLLPDAAGRALLIEGSAGLSVDYVRGVNETNPVRLGAGTEPEAPSTRAYRERRSVRIRDTLADDDFVPWGGVAREQGYRSMISVPLLVAGEPVGTLNCYTRTPHEYGADETELLGLLADQAGVAITTARQQELHRRGASVHEELTAVVLRGGGVSGVARALAELLDRPVSVTDEPGGATVVEVPRAGRSVDAAVRGSWLAWPVMLGSEEVARILVGGGSEPLAPLDRRALEQAVTVCALELLRERTALEAQWRVSGEVVGDLLTGNPAALRTVIDRAARLGHDLDRPYALVVGAGDPGRATAGERLLSVARSAAAELSPRGLVTVLGDDVVLLWPATDPAEPLRGARELRRRLGRARVDAVVAVSPPCTSPPRYPAVFRRLRGAARLARLRGLAPADDVVTLEALGVQGLLLQLDDPAELVRFAMARLAPVREYDAARGTHIEETLRAFLDHDLSTAATAAALFVHPNTVGLRVRRAERLLGHRLGAIRQLAELQVAMGAVEVLESQELGTSTSPGGPAAGCVHDR